MKKWLGLRGPFLACLVVAGFFSYANVLASPKYDNHLKREPIMENLYPVLFANTLQNSLTHATVHVAGKEAWRKRRAEIELGAAGYLLVSRSAVFIVAAERITAVDTNGKELWFHNKWTNSPVVLCADALYCQSYRKKSQLEQVALDGGKTLKADISLPSTGGKEKALFIDPLQNDFLACCQLPASQVVMGGKPKSFPPHYTVYRKPYDNWDFTWVAEGLELIVLPIMHISAKKQLCIGTQHSMIFYNSESMVNEPIPTGHFNYPMQFVKNACADSTGNLYFVGKSDKAEELVSCDDKGNVKWKWDRAGIAESVQPPVVGSDGEILVTSGRTVCCIKNGKIVWEFSTGRQDPKYLTASSDGSVLVAASDLLYCCKTGKELFTFDAGSTIIAPPVVDIDGNMYILTFTELIKVI